jgi:esterase/lipase superfamily enzyme
VDFVGTIEIVQPPDRGQQKNAMLAFTVSLCVLAVPPLVLSDEAIIREGVRDKRGVVVHHVTSPFQAGTTSIQVLVPDAADRCKPMRILYLLPVEALDGRRWGDALEEVRKTRLHTRHQLLCVYPTFSHLPWYADHPVDLEIRQERYLLEVVMPFVEQNYHDKIKNQVEQPIRLLVGFSKSGWGAFSLILRHPELFQRAAAWDAPLMQEQPNRFGMGPIFGGRENFRRYQISELLAKPDATFLESPRLIHLGYDNFREHHRRAEQLMNENKVQHIYHDGPQRRHHWNSGWLEEAIDLLAKTPAK